MSTPSDHPMMDLVSDWAERFGWLDGRIDLHIDDLTSFATRDCTLTAHAPVWGTKPGAERALPIADVRARLARILKVGRATRHDMHVAFHPDGRGLAIFARIRARVAFLPFTIRTQPLVFVMHAVDTDGGLRISTVDEWEASDPAAAARVLVDHHGWPADTTLQPHVALGAAS